LVLDRSEVVPSNKYIPSYIDNIFYDPKKDCLGLYLIANCDQAKQCTTDGLTKIFKDKGIPYKLMIDKTMGSILSVYAVLDFTGKQNMKEAVEREVRTLFNNGIITLEYGNTNIPGLVCNIKSFPLLLDLIGTMIPVTAFTHPFISYLFGALYDTFGTGGLSIIWMMGRESAEAMRSLKALQLSTTNKINIALIQLQILGWGKYELEIPDNKRANIKIYDNFECLATKDLKGYQSSFMRGMFTGLAALLLERKVNCIEKKCIRNGDTHCEFSLE
jgi:predicted hydrocarbon binding protein